MNQLPPKDQEAARAAFSALCEPGASTVSGDDLVGALGALGFAQRNPELAQMLGSLSGSLGLDDFASLTMVNKSASFGEEEQRAIFAAFDDEGLGQVSYVKFEVTMNQLGFMLPEDEMKSLFAFADKDGDGRINVEDWLEVMGKSTLC